ncbi:hypothetical protein Syun_025557 [Stephania yunnanensis]|uniref:Uncharacterized protein n=1 Tax=Stephania yunnanensis TaxID=152371 RepID=A0AAP0EUT3_9MAGN
MIRMRDCKADRLVQLYLSFFSIAKLILLVLNPKKARYPLKGIARWVEVDELLEGLGELYEEYIVPLFERYLQFYLNKAIPIGLHWRPTWSSIPNSGSGRWGRNAWKVFLPELAAPYNYFWVMTAERGGQAPLSAAPFPDVGLPRNDNTTARQLTRSLLVFILDATGLIMNKGLLSGLHITKQGNKLRKKQKAEQRLAVEKQSNTLKIGPLESIKG